jgi:uncharacterized protein (TIGR01777 family)
VRIVISGSSGLVGTALVQQLRRDGHEVVRLVRGDGAPSADGADAVPWDPAGGHLDPAALEGADAVVNLSGAGIGDHRWTEAYKRTLAESRIRPTNLLAEAIAARADGPRVLLSASGVHFYGDRGDEVLDEASTPGSGFLPALVRDWEASTATAQAAGARVVHLRSGVVLTPDAGALQRMLPLFKLGVGGRFGSGRQWMSWITLADEVRAIVHLLHSQRSGPVNLTAPQPVRNAELAAALGAALRRPAIVPVPKFGPRLVLGSELADTLLFQSERVLPGVLSDDGFQFSHPDLPTALEELLARKRSG